MSETPAWWRGLVVAIIVLCLAFALNATAAEQKTASTFATVDVEKVNTEFVKRKLAESEMRALDAKYKARLQRRNSNIFLAEDELKQLDDLEEKDQKTPADTAKIKEINDKGTKLQNDIDSLRAKPDDKLAPDEKTRLQQAEKDFQAAKARFDALKDQYSREMQAKVDESSDKLMQMFRAAVGVVAEKKGITIVFNSTFALYAGTDLTQPVIAELNKK